MIEVETRYLRRATNMGKIVVGCDGSPSAADAVAWAAGELKKIYDA